MRITTPFPDERPSRALREEDAFMECHGGRGARTIYLAIQSIARLAAALTASCGWLFSGSSERHIDDISLGANPMQETQP